MLFAVFSTAIAWSLLAWMSLSAIFAGRVLADGSDGDVLVKRSTPQATTLACKLFSQIFPSQTYYPNGTQYESENQHYYDAAAWLGPACVVVPNSVVQTSYVVKALSQLGAKFAVRGAGHMPIAGAANIDSTGVLVSTSSLTSLELAADKSTVTVGAGTNWADVQRYLEPSGVVAVGGRVGLVGVPGYLLGGGISFHSAQYGFASANVVQFECVLAGGDVVYAKESGKYSDLFWALKGGGNSFAIVTAFTLKVYPSTSVWVGNAEYAPTDKANFLQGVTHFAHQPDSKAAVIPIIAPTVGTTTASYTLTRFYDSSTASGANASAFRDFTPPKMLPLADTYSPRPLSQYLDLEIDPLVSQLHGVRTKFYAASSKATLKAVTFVHDTLLKEVQSLWAAELPFVYVTCAVQPISKHFIKASGDVPQGVDAEEGPFFWYTLSVAWTLPSGDAAVEEFVKGFDKAVNEGLDEKGLRTDYLYMNDADEGQPIFQNYPEANLLRLKEIRSKYDPKGVLTKQMPGGWKVEDA